MQSMQVLKYERPAWTVTKLAVILLLLFTVGAARAHELRPAIFALTLDKARGLELRASLNLEAVLAGIGGEHANTSESAEAPVYEKWRASDPATLRAGLQPRVGGIIEGLQLTFDGAPVTFKLANVVITEVGDPAIARVSILTLRARAPDGVSAMNWWADERFGANVFRARRAGETEPFHAVFLRPGEASDAIDLTIVGDVSEGWEFARYIAIGFEHILPKGLDHILFIVGLFLLSARLRPLLWQVTGFTLAHSVTLALAMYGLVAIPPGIVEPLIAASIAFIAIENLFTDRLRRWRPAVVFAFGLLHGLGFAGVLQEIGLPRDQFLGALLAFNFGVELGQIAVLGACFLIVGLWFRERRWYRQAIAMPASLLIALVASFWVVERLA